MRRTLASSVFLLQKEMLHSLCRRGEGKVFSVWLSQSESGQNGTKQLKKVLKNKNRDLTQSTNLQLGTARNCQGRQWQSCISMRGPFRPSLSANIKYVIIVTAMNVEDKQIKRGVHFDLMAAGNLRHQRNADVFVIASCRPQISSYPLRVLRSPTAFQTKETDWVSHIGWGVKLTTH